VSQGIKWIKNRFEKRLTVIRIGQKGYLDIIERSAPLSVLFYPTDLNG
jgi:hypothetical protein